MDEASAEEAAAAAQSLGVNHVVVRDPSGGCVVATERGTHVLSGELRGLHTAMDGVFDGLLLAGMARGLTTEGAVQRTLELLNTESNPLELPHVGLDMIPTDWHALTP